MTERTLEKAEAELDEFNARPSLLTEGERLKIAKECSPPGIVPSNEDSTPKDPGTDGGAT